MWLMTITLGLPLPSSLAAIFLVDFLLYQTSNFDQLFFFLRKKNFDQLEIECFERIVYIATTL